MGKKQFCFFETAETGNRTPDSGVKGRGANHYPRAPAHSAVEQRCLSKHTLPLANSGETRLYITGQQNRLFRYKLKLPDVMTCEQCVIQWKYHTGELTLRSGADPEGEVKRVSTPFSKITVLQQRLK